MKLLRCLEMVRLIVLPAACEMLNTGRVRLVVFETRTERLSCMAVEWIPPFFGSSTG